MLEQLLSKLPYVLTFWTSALLCWGLFLNFRMLKALKLPCAPEIQKLRVYNIASTTIANVILFLYLMFEPSLAKSIGDAIIVINVFYTAFLVFASVVIDEWFHVKP